MNVDQVATMGTRIEQAQVSQDLGVAVLDKALDQAREQGKAMLKLVQGVDQVAPRYVDRMA